MKLNYSETRIFCEKNRCSYYPILHFKQIDSHMKLNLNSQIFKMWIVFLQNIWQVNQPAVPLSSSRRPPPAVAASDPTLSGGIKDQRFGKIKDQRPNGKDQRSIRSPSPPPAQFPPCASPLRPFVSGINYFEHPNMFHCDHKGKRVGLTLIVRGTSAKTKLLRKPTKKKRNAQCAASVSHIERKLVIYESTHLDFPPLLLLPQPLLYSKSQSPLLLFFSLLPLFGLARLAVELLSLQHKHFKNIYKRVSHSELGFHHNITRLNNYLTVNRIVQFNYVSRKS